MLLPGMLDIWRIILQLSTLLQDLQTQVTELIVSILLFSMTPMFLLLSSDPVLIQVGATLGLARLLLITVTIVVGFIMLITPFRNHGERAGRVLSSMVSLVAFTLLYFPLIDLGIFISTAVRSLVLSLVDVEPDNLQSALSSSPLGATSPLGHLVVVALLVLFGTVLLIPLLAMSVVFILIVMVFPLVLVLRPLGGFFNSLFHVMTSGILVILLSPALMALGMTLPLFVGKYFPFGHQPVAQIIALILGFCGAIAAPILIWKRAYRESVSIFGKAESVVTGKVSVEGKSRVDVEQIKRDDRITNSPTKAVVTSMVTGAGTMAALSKDDPAAFRQGMKHVAMDAAAAGMKAGGHPVMAAGIQAYDSRQKVKEQQQRDTQDAESSTPDEGVENVRE